MNSFTPRAQQVLALARKEASRLNHNYVGTDHLLLGPELHAQRKSQTSTAQTNTELASTMVAAVEAVRATKLLACESQLRLCGPAMRATRKKFSPRLHPPFPDRHAHAFSGFRPDECPL
jgi:ATP-dependent Clp protease ATP-binding subunit ClpA